MSWLSVTGTILYYISLPFATLFQWLLIALSPILYLGHYMSSALIVPLKMLAKLETLYIFLGVAASIGLVAGSILYASSTVLVSVLNLNPVPEAQGRTAASVRAARERKKLEQAWQNSAIKSEDGAWKSDGSMEKKYVEWFGKGGRVPRREETILEEDDDSEY